MADKTATLISYDEHGSEIKVQITQNPLTHKLRRELLGMERSYSSSIQKKINGLTEPARTEFEHQRATGEMNVVSDEINEELNQATEDLEILELEHKRAQILLGYKEHAKEELADLVRSSIDEDFWQNMSPESLDGAVNKFRTVAGIARK